MSGRWLRVVSPVVLLAAVVVLPTAHGAGADVASPVKINVTVSPSPAAAGSDLSVKAVAVDSSGHTLTSYSGSGTWSDLSGVLTPAAPANFVNGVSTSTAQVSLAYKNDTISVSSGGASGTSRAFSVYGPITHITFGSVGAHRAGAPFTLTATAMDSLNQKVANYNGGATWSDLSGSSLGPAAPSDFVDGVSKTANASVANPTHNDVISILSGGASGTSGAFNVYGDATHIAVGNAGNHPAGSAFSVTATAQDANGSTVLDYSDPGPSWTDSSGTLAPSAPAPFANGVSKTAIAQLQGLQHGDKITIQTGSLSGASPAFNLFGSLDHIAIGTPINPAAGSPFTITATALDALQSPVADYNGSATWSDGSGSLQPSQPANFANGVSKTTTATVPNPYHADTITVLSGGVQVTTKAFNVLGSPDHIIVIAPATVSAPSQFIVTATMYDSAGNVLTTYNGTATWTDLSGSLRPSAPTSFVKGVSKSANASVPTAVDPNQISVHSGGITGTSTPFHMPVINPSSETGHVNQGVSFSGTGWTPNATIWMGVLDSTTNQSVQFCTLHADASGSIASTGCTVLGTLDPSDTYHLKAFQTNNNKVSWLDPSQFSVVSTTVNPQATWSGNAVYPGNDLSVSGTGFAPNSNLTVTLVDESNNSTTLNTTPASPATDGTGNFSSLSFTIPSSASPGSYMLLVTDGSNNSASETVTVLTPPSITTSAEAGAPTQNLNLGGSHWDPNQTVLISLHDDTTSGDHVFCSPTADGNGDLPATVCALPEVAAGDNYRLTASEAGHPNVTWSDPNTFTLNQLAVWSANSARPTEKLTVSGYGFSADSPLTVTLLDSSNSSTQLITIPASPRTGGSGSFGAFSFTVPATTAGSYTLRVSDGSGKTQSEVLTIPTWILAGSESGAPGQLSSFTGSGWDPNPVGTFTTIVSVGLFDDTTHALVLNSTGNVCNVFTNASGGVVNGQNCLLPDAPADHSYHLVAVEPNNQAMSSSDPNSFSITQVASWGQASSIPGGHVTVSGRGFAASSALSFSLTDSANNSVSLSSVEPSPKTLASGAFTQTYNIIIPATTAPGSYTLAVTDAKGNSKSEALTVRNPQIVPASESGAPGQLSSFTGSGWDPNPVGTFTTIVSVGLFDDTTHALVLNSTGNVCNVFTNASGGVVNGQNCLLPDAPADHSYHLVAVEPNNQAMSSSDPNSFSITQVASWGQASSSPGGHVTVSGRGFAASSALSFSLTDSANNSVSLSSVEPSPKTLASGAFTQTYNIIIPATTAPGSYTLAVTDAKGNSKSEALTVRNPQIVPASESGAPGQLSSFTGSGWDPNPVGTFTTIVSVGLFDDTTHALVLNSTGNVCNVFTNASGGVVNGQNCLLPDAPADHSYHLVAVEPNNQAMSSSDPNSFSITQVASWGQASSIPGGHVTVSGRGFAASSALSFSLTDSANNSVSLSSVEPSPKTLASGAFTQTYNIIIPATTAPGSYTLAVTDAKGNSKSEALTVRNPQIVPASESGAPGQLLSFTGSGWDPNPVGTFTTIVSVGLFDDTTHALVLNSTGNVCNVFTNASGGVVNGQNCLLPDAPADHSYHLVAVEPNNQAMSSSDPNTFTLQ